MVRLEVRDEGPGLTEEDKQRLFGFFQRLSAKPTGGESSSGVGLSSVKKIVELHGGHVWAESTNGDGTTFIVDLPIGENLNVELTHYSNAADLYLIN
jgi:signal transduction histidine kinase